MRRAIPDAELLILKHAGMDAIDNHIVQHTRANVVGPVVLDFLGRHPVAWPPLSPHPASGRGTSHLSAQIPFEE